MYTIVLNIFLDFWQVFQEMAPYLLFGFFMAGLLSVCISPATVEKHLGGHGIWPVVKAALLGVPLPLCSCGVIPVAASLRRHGASRGATIAFLISTPQTGVDSILVTLSLLGPVFAIFRPVVAFISGIVGGALSVFFDIPEKKQYNSASRGDDEYSSDSENSNKLVRIFKYGFVTIPQDIAKALLVGLLIAGLITSIIPDDFFSGVLGTGIGAMLVMMACGIPMYVCATASVPIAVALIAKGVSPGAALVFLMTGPATNAATVATIWQSLGRRSAIIYLVSVAMTALASGLLLDGIIHAGVVPPMHHMGWMMPHAFNTVAAFVLLGVLGFALFYKESRTEPSRSIDEDMTSLTLAVSGMTCDHCAHNVRTALLSCTGVSAVMVKRESGIAIVYGKQINRTALLKAVQASGYSAEIKSM